MRFATAGRPGPSPAVRIGYAALGLIAGGLWLLGSGDPLWLHALRVLAIVLVVPAVASRLAAAVARRRGQQKTETLSVGRLVAIKAGLVIVAIAVTGLLGSRVAHLDLYLAAWLALTVAVGGPVIHHRLLVEVTGGQRPHRGRARPSKERRRPRRRRYLLLTAGLAACVVLAGVADLVVGHVISDRISATASKRLTGPVSVSIGATPALYDAVTGRIPAVTIHAPSTAVCNLRDVDVRATLTDVRRSNSRVTTQGVSADMVVTALTFAGLISSDFGTPTVTPDPSAGVLRIGIGPGGLLQIEEKAQLHGDTIQLSPAGMSLHGQPVPDSLKGTIASHLTISRTLSGLPLNLTPRSLAITGTGLQVRFAAGPATLTGTRSAPACATR